MEQNVIVSHKYHFIFIKTQKTAGTSTEIALSKYCGEDDIITPISNEDVRSALGYPGPQNVEINLRRNRLGHNLHIMRQIGLVKFIQIYRGKSAKPPKFYNHAPASFIKTYLPRRVWDSYYKIAIERNPWDKIISYYYWLTRPGTAHEGKSLPEFLRSRAVNTVKGYELYTINGEVVVDQLLRYEDLPTEMERLQDKLGLADVPELPFTKHEYRDDRRPYQDVLSEEEAQIVAEVFAKEIALMGYTWD